MDKDYLKKLFINEAKPALDRHSGGGGSGSSDLIDCERLPTEGVEDGKVYRAQWSETVQNPDAYKAYAFMGDGSYGDASEILGLPISVTETLDGLSYGLYLYVDDGMIYYSQDGAVMRIDAVVGGESLGYIEDPSNIDNDDDVMRFGTVKSGEAFITTRNMHVGLTSESDNVNIFQNVNGAWNAFGLVRNLMNAKSPPDCMQSLSITSLEGIIGYFDTSKVTSMNNMFYNCNALTTVPLFDTSKVTNMSHMFHNCNALTTVPLFDTKNVIDMDSMFSVCNALTTVPLFDTKNVTNTNSMFSACIALTTVPLFDTSKVTSMYGMFDGCSALTTVPLFDTSKVTNMGSMFYNCKALTTVPLFDTSKVTSMASMFYKCSALTTVPLFDTKNVTNTNSMFNGCSALTTVPSFDIRNVTNTISMFYNCNALTDCRVKNITIDITVGSGTSYGHLLTKDSLVHLIYELRRPSTSSKKTLTVGSSNLTKLKGIYVKTVDITDEMRAEDDLIDEKLPFVVCESTDEGATLITDYVGFKKWQLA